MNCGGSTKGTNKVIYQSMGRGSKHIVMVSGRLDEGNYFYQKKCMIHFGYHLYR